MLTKDDYTIINIKQYLDLIDKNIIREDEFNKLLSDFLCPKNKDVELFLKSKAIEFTRKDSSVTYLVFSNEDSITPVGYFCIALKPLTIKGKILSSKSESKSKI